MISPACRALGPLARALAATVTLASALGCGQAVTHLGPTPAEARAHADTMLGALGARFGPHDLDAAMAEIRPRLLKSAFVPSGIFDDSALWTRAQGDVRILELAGSRTGGRYLIGVYPSPPAPARPADYRGTIVLQQLARGQYEWQVHDALALGDVRGDDLANALTALFTAAEHEQNASVRAEYRAMLPTATAVLGRLFSLDRIDLHPDENDATSITLGLTMHPERMEDDYPHFARYLDKYLSPAHLQLVVYDDAGRQWWSVRGDGTHFTVRLRVHDGSLAPLGGPPRPMPSRLHARVDAETKLFIFHVGLRHLIADVSLTRAGHDKGFVATFREEPDWVLPPLVASMIRTPLRRPFEGAGALLSLDVRDSAGAETLVTRDYRLAIQESPLTRWLGGLGDSALSDFHRGAEQEMDRFTGEAFAALDEDVRALELSPAAAPGAR